MNTLDSRIYLKEKRTKASDSRRFNIHDRSDDKKIGKIQLKLNQLKNIQVKPNSQHKYIATESLLALLHFLSHDINCHVRNSNTPAIKLFSSFAQAQPEDSTIKFVLEYNYYKHISWTQIYLNKLQHSEFISSEDNSHKLIQLASRLKLAGKDMFNRDCYLHPKALKAWKKMQHKANMDGIDLQIISAFRSLEYQNQLILNKLNKGKPLEEIIKVNTLAGYSEHHTGFAIDIGSKEQPILETEFEQSPAFKWLIKNAKAFNFYLSYPKNNNSGIIYEPWHWCYII